MIFIKDIFSFIKQVKCFINNVNFFIKLLIALTEHKVYKIFVPFSLCCPRFYNNSKKSTHTA